MDNPNTLQHDIENNVRFRGTLNWRAMDAFNVVELPFPVISEQKIHDEYTLGRYGVSIITSRRQY